MFEKQEKYDRLAEAVSKPTALIGVSGLLIIAILTIVDVLSRTMTGTPFIGMHDLFGLVIIIVVATSFPTGVLLRKHVAIEFLGKGLGSRAHRYLDFFGALVLTFFLIIIAWQVTDFAWDKMMANEYTFVLQWKTAPAWWIAAAIIWLSVPMQILVTLRILFPRQKPSGPSEETSQ